MSEWCKHNGDSRTPNTTIVDLRLRDGSEKHGEHADMWHWNHSGQAGDIMEYRIAAALPEPDASERSECALELRMHAMVLRNNPEPLSKECRHELSTALERAAALLSRSLGEPTVPIATPYGESEPDRETGFSVGSPRDRPDTGDEAEDKARVAKAVAPYRARITATPELLSLLYDIDLLPEQIRHMANAIRMVAVCEMHDRIVEAERERDEATALLLEVKPLLAQVALQALVGSEMYRAAKHSVNRIDSHLASPPTPAHDPEHHPVGFRCPVCAAELDDIIKTGLAKRDAPSGARAVVEDARAQIAVAFTDALLAEYTAGDCWGYDIDGGAFQDMAVKAGLFLRTNYDPEVHGENDVDAETGDEWFIINPDYRAREALRQYGETMGEKV